MFFTVNGDDTTSWFPGTNYRLAIVTIGKGGSFWERPFGRVDNLSYQLTMTLVDKLTFQPAPMVNYMEKICSELFSKDDVKLSIYNLGCYYVGKFQGDKINSNSLHQSYFSVKFDCSYPYGFLEKRTESYRNSSSTERTFTIDCASSLKDKEMRPIVRFTNKSTSNLILSVENKTTQEIIEFNFTGAIVNDKLLLNEIINVDCGKKEINSNTDLNRYKYWNGKFITLVPGENVIGVKGNVEIQIIYVPTVRR